MLAQGAPLGYFLLLQFLARDPSLNESAIIYSYLCVSTTFVFSTLGYIVGRGQDRTRREAFTDPLTGLANRRGLTARIARKLAHASVDKPIALLLLDVDRLKVINDEQGHLHGDAALRAVAKAILSVSRDADVAARTGGDEFVLAGDLTAPQAMDVAARIRRYLSRTIPPGFKNPIFVSIGVACTAKPMQEAELFQLADRALYRAKEEGRNRTVLAEPGTSLAGPA